MPCPQEVTYQSADNALVTYQSELQKFSGVGHRSPFLRMWPSCGTAFLAFQRQFDFHECPQHDLSGHTPSHFCIPFTH